MEASLFYSASPFHPKTISRQENKFINPDSTIDGILKNFGGKYFRII